MVHDQHVFTHGMYLPFCFLCHAQSLLWVHPVWVHSPVQSGGSLIFFQLFRCRNLALNRVFSYFLVVGMFLYLGGVWMPPCLYTPSYIHMPPIHLYTPRGVHTPHRPPSSSVHLHGFGAFACCGGLLSTLNVCWDTSLTPPLFGVPPP